MARVAILGGGVAGLIVAHELTRRCRGLQVELLEKSSALGGLHRTIQADGLKFDIGAFFFERDHQLFSTFPSLRDCYVPSAPRVMTVTPTGDLDMYPVTLRGYVRGHGITGLTYAMADLLCCKVRYCRYDTLPSFVKFYTGGTIYRTSGLQHYITRLYGLEDSEVGLEFARQRMAVMKRLTLHKLIARSASTAIRRRIRPQAPAAFYVRPKEGFIQAYTRIRDQLERDGVSVRLNVDLDAVRRTADGFEIDADGQVERYDRVISTIPLPALFRLARQPMRQHLDFMTLYSMFYRGRMNNDATVLYNFTHRGRWKRLTVFSRHYGPADRDDDYFTVEVTTRFTDPQTLAEARHDFEEHACALGLTAQRPQLVGDAVTPNAYPVFRNETAEALHQAKAEMRTFGFDLVGRQGKFEYSTSDTVVVRAKEFARQFATETGWAH